MATLNKFTPVTSLKPFIGTVEHLRRELAWGMSIHRASLSLEHPETFKLLAAPTRLLGESLLQGIDLVRNIASLAYQGGIKPYDFRAEKRAVVEVESQLLQTKRNVRNELERILETLGPDYSQLPQDVCDLSLAMISLLQVSTDSAIGPRGVSDAISDGDRGTKGTAGLHAHDNPLRVVKLQGVASTGIAGLARLTPALFDVRRTRNDPDGISAPRNQSHGRGGARRCRRIQSPYPRRRSKERRR